MSIEDSSRVGFSFKPDVVLPASKILELDAIFKQKGHYLGAELWINQDNSTNETIRITDRIMVDNESTFNFSG